MSITCKKWQQSTNYYATFCRARWSLSAIPIYYIHCYQRRLLLSVSVEHPSEEPIQDGYETQRILAYSAVLPEEQYLLSRLVQWCNEWIQAIWEVIQVSLRVSEITLRLSPLILLSPAAYLTYQWTDSQRPNALVDMTWNYVLHVVQKLGPGYVKLCQWVSTRRDIFPAVVCDRLSHLCDKGYPHSLRESHQILRHSFGDGYERALKLDSVIGCGSAAQVYRGSLTVLDPITGEPTETPVAVKILHPWFRRQIEQDLWLMETLAKWLHALPSDAIRMINLPRVVDNFGGNLRRQSDLTLEGDNLIQFRRNFYGNDDDESRSAILFPQPKLGWISREVLVEDLVENATPISDFLKDNTELGMQTRKELATPLLNSFLKMVFSDNFVHADIHPGNVLIQTTTTTTCTNPKTPNNLIARMFHSTEKESNDIPRIVTKRNIVFLDAGIVTSLDDNDRKNLKDLFRAVLLNKGYEAGRLMVERAKYERCSQTEGGVEAFATGVGDIVGEFHDRRKSGLTLGAVRIGSLLGQVLDLCRVHGVEIDPSMASIVISTLVLEGLGRSLEPTLNLMDCAVPFVLGRGNV